jgi:hypothetical protein
MLRPALMLGALLAIRLDDPVLPDVSNGLCKAWEFFPVETDILRRIP